MMPLVAILVVFGGFMSFNLNDASSWKAIYSIIGILTTAIGILGLFLIEDKEDPKKEEISLLETILYSFKKKTASDNKELYLILLGFAIFGVSIQIFMPYLIIYYEQSLQLSNYVLIMAPAIVIAAVVTALYGKVYDEKGFMESIKLPLALLIVGYSILYLSKNTILVFIGSLAMMSGYLCGMSVFGAKIRDLIPENRGGQFQGVRIIGQVFLPGVIGPKIGEMVLANADRIINSDGTTSFLPNESI